MKQINIKAEYDDNYNGLFISINSTTTIQLPRDDYWLVGFNPDTDDWAVVVHLAYTFFKRNCNVNAKYENKEIELIH